MNDYRIMTRGAHGPDGFVEIPDAAGNRYFVSDENGEQYGPNFATPDAAADHAVMLILLDYARAANDAAYVIRAQARDTASGRLQSLSRASWWDTSCEHGLSAELCDGPDHYPADRPEDDVPF